MFCPECGEKLPDGAKFCMNCGYKLPESISAVPTIPIEQPETANTQQEGSAQEKIKDLTQKLGSKVNQVADSITAKIPEGTTEAIGSATANIKSSMGNMVDQVKQTISDHSSSDKAVKTTTQVSESFDAGDQPKTSETEDQAYQAKKKNFSQKFQDVVADTVTSKLRGQKLETVRISMDDMLDLLTKNFINEATTEDEYKVIQKTVNGSLMGSRTLDSKDGNYHIVVAIGGTITLSNPNDSNWIRISDFSAGKIYQYSSLKWGKFKKAVKLAIAEAEGTDISDIEFDEDDDEAGVE